MLKFKFRFANFLKQLYVFLLPHSKCQRKRKRKRKNEEKIAFCPKMFPHSTGQDLFLRGQNLMEGSKYYLFSFTFCGFTESVQSYKTIMHGIYAFKLRDIQFDVV